MSSRTDPHEGRHAHVFLGPGHERHERRTWHVIALCGCMMFVEIAGGAWFGSLALVADGLHMSTHAGALLIAALAYTYARRHAEDRRFAFGTGKLGDLAGFTSAIVLALVALLIGYEAVVRWLAPVPIRFAEAIPIAVAGLVVNVVSAWLLGGHHGDVLGGDHGHEDTHRHDGPAARSHAHGHPHGHPHAHSHGHPHGHGHGVESFELATPAGTARLSIFEENVPPRFRIAGAGDVLRASDIRLETRRPDGTGERYRFVARQDYWESVEAIPEPHEFAAELRLGSTVHSLAFVEAHAAVADAVHQDHSLRSAYVHVLADALVSILAIAGLLLAWRFGWLWMDPLAGLIGAAVIANWSYGLARDAVRVLLDVVPDVALERSIRASVEADGDRVVDLHLWRLGPGHLGLALAVVPRQARAAAFYHDKLARFRAISHATIEVAGTPSA